ncbi:sugar ABC transporter permease [Lachnospiraceae bacterium ZAX-1]
MRKKSHLMGKKFLAIYLLPGLLIYSFIIIIPLIMGARQSLVNSSGDFNYFKNYMLLAKDKEFWMSFVNNLFIILISVIGEIGIGFLISILLTSKKIFFKEFHRTVVFLPVVLSSVVVGFIWRLIYDKSYGLLDLALRTMGLESWIRPWLDSISTVMYAVTAPLVWQWIGLYVVIIVSALTSIPIEIFDAAEIDGANLFQRTTRITLPLLKDTLLVCIMVCVSGVMKIFDHIYVMTGGGPGISSQVLAMYAYKKSFIQFELGYGSTISMGMIILSYCLIFLSRLVIRGESDYA